MTMAPALIEAARGRFVTLIADRGYDSNAIRAAVHAQGAEVVIPTAFPQICFALRLAIFHKPVVDVLPRCRIEWLVDKRRSPLVKDRHPMKMRERVCARWVVHTCKTHVLIYQY